jgi:hypothetical protein
MGGTTAYFNGGIVHLENPDICDQQITVKGRVWRFDFDHRFGPLWLRKDGGPRKHQCPPDAVWDAFAVWFDSYNAEASERRDQAAFAGPDGCQKIQEEN